MTTQIEITSKEAYKLLKKHQVAYNSYQQPSTHDPLVIKAEYQNGKLVRIVRYFPPCF